MNAIPDPVATPAAPTNLGGSTGAASSHVEGERLHAVVNTLLGDMPGQNGTAASGGQGTVTLVTPRTVSPALTYVLLEHALVDNNARMVCSGGMSPIVPATAALPSGAITPCTGGAAARGFEGRVVSLRDTPATDLETALKLHVRANAIVAADSGRHAVPLSGSRIELERCLRRIGIVDIDGLPGMSVGAFARRHRPRDRVEAGQEHRLRDHHHPGAAPGRVAVVHPAGVRAQQRRGAQPRRRVQPPCPRDAAAAPGTGVTAVTAGGPAHG